MSENNKNDSIIERFVSPLPQSEDKKEEQSLPVSLANRPKSFGDFPGQHSLKKLLHVYVEAAKQRKEPLDHTVFHGPPGLGKTTLAQIVAKEMDVDVVATSAPAIEKPGDLVGLLTNIQRNSVLFLDEIHRLPIQTEEILYSAMEDNFVDLIIGQGVGSRSMKMPIEPFTLIGATTKLSKLSAPLLNRFGIQLRFDFYDPESLSKIILRDAKNLNFFIDEAAAQVLAGRSRGTPRIAKRLLRRARDFAEFEKKSSIDKDFINHVLNHLSIDLHGLDSMDRKILDTVHRVYDGGPVGIEALAATLGESRNTLEDVYEPFLVHKQLLTRTPRGRALSAAGLAIAKDV